MPDSAEPGATLVWKVVWSVENEASQWDILPTDRVLVDNFTGGSQEEIVILQFDQESERRAWIGLHWDAKESVMRAGAVARGHLVDDAGNSSFPIHFSQRVFVGRFGSSDHAAFLVQDDRAMLIAEWNDLGFFGRRIIDERLGAWTFAAADELAVPKPLPDGSQSVVARRDSMIGLLDIGSDPMQSSVVRYDETELRLVPPRRSTGVTPTSMARSTCPTRSGCSSRCSKAVRRSLAGMPRTRTTPASSTSRMRSGCSTFYSAGAMRCPFRVRKSPESIPRRTSWRPAVSKADP